MEETIQNLSDEELFLVTNYRETKDADLRCLILEIVGKLAELYYAKGNEKILEALVAA